MSERLTKRWTDTLEEAYGKNGAKGLAGEKWVESVMHSWGWYCKLNESDYQMQIDGKDITFRNPKWANSYTGDVKNNLNDYGTFYVDLKKLRKSKADRWFHCNPKTGWLYWYGVKEMVDFLKNREDDEPVKFTAKECPKFVTKRKIGVIK